MSVFRLKLPPLRERRDDIRELTELFVDEYNVKAGKRVSTVPEEVWQRFASYDWPGNVRELRNVVERGVLLADGTELPARWLQLPGNAASPRDTPVAQGPGIWLPLDGSISLDGLEQRTIEAALDATKFNVAAAARLLGTTRQTLRYRIQKYEIALPE